MRYISLLAMAATLMIASGCNPQTPGTDEPAVCANCGKRHYARQDTNFKFSPHASAVQSLGWRLVPVTGVEIPNYPGDYGPAQVFEVQGPPNTAIELGRVWPTCNCIEVVSGTGSYPAGTPARIVLRQVKAPPEAGVELTAQIIQPKHMLLTAQIPAKK